MKLLINCTAVIKARRVTDKCVFLGTAEVGFGERLYSCSAMQGLTYEIRVTNDLAIILIAVVSFMCV